jgi:hypothetical protein
MKKVMMLLVAGLLGLGAATQSASASTFDLGTVTPGVTSGLIVNAGIPAPSQFDDTLNFSLSGVQTALIGSLTDIESVLTDSVNFTVDLFSTSDPTTSLGSFSGAGTVLAFSYLNLAAGDYFFGFSGDVGGSFGNAYTYRFEVSEVPLPPALLLFATALGGMAVASYRRRKNGGAAKVDA